MSAAALVADLAGRGVTLALERGELKARGPRSAFTSDALAEIRAHKADVIALLSAREARDGRTAILEHEAGLPRDEAERIAATVARQDEAIIVRWRAEITAAPYFANPWRRLKGASLRFLSSAHATEAVEQGWTELDLWAVFSGDSPAIPIRVDAQGLVPGIALSTFNYRIVDVTPQLAILETGALAHHRSPRGPSCAAAVVWWRHPVLLGGTP